MRAVVVLPTPRTPVRIQACGMRPASKPFDTVRTMASWPIRSSKVEGRYLRASTRYEPGFSIAASLIVLQNSAAACGAANGAGSRFARCEIKGWEADERPEPRSLGLLPSGPDPVGEWLVHRQPPGDYIGRGGGESKPKRQPSW